MGALWYLMNQRHSNIIQFQGETKANNSENSDANEAGFGLQQNICKQRGKICMLIIFYQWELCT